jgi:acetyl-CoA synthetase
VGDVTYEQACAAHGWAVPDRYNIAADVCDRHPRDALAMVHEDPSGAVRELHWGELQDFSRRFAVRLAAAGVQPGDRVAMLLPPIPEAAAAFLATWRSGAILLSMSVLYGDDGIRHRVQDADPKVLVTDEANRQRVPDGFDGEVLLLGPGSLDEGSTDFADVDTAADDPAQLYYTSGTTGLAKGILHAHRFLLAHEEFRYCHDLREGEAFHGMGEWAWAAGIAPLLGPWRHGAVQYVLQRAGGFDAHKQLDFLSRHGVTNVFATPTAIRSMMSIADAGTRYPMELRIVCSAGEPLNPEAIRWFRDQYGVTVLDYYGLSESYPLVANFPFMEVREGSMGKPMPGWDVVILDEDERPVAAGERGEICLRARSNPHYPLGYWNDDEAGRETFGGDWFHTKDAASQDEDGYVCTRAAPTT